ncbi:hypothetical protein BC629DRAFT_915944 [Irpex lacteus]|nr:hypothetical protein BC629DRAFT_915944 [Irpex lacteus]
MSSPTVLTNRLKATSFTTFGNFALGSPERVWVPRKSAGSNAVPSPDSGAWFMSYSTTLQCTRDQFLPAKVRIFSPRDESLPPNTVVFLLGRVCTARSSATPMIETILAHPFPGNPADPDYEANLPDMPHQEVILLGIVCGNVESLADGARGFKVEAQARVCGEDRRSTVLCVLEAGRRWQYLTVPSPNTTVLVHGRCRHVLPNGDLAVSVDEITLNANIAVVPANSPLTPGTPGNQPFTPQKRRRYNAFDPSSPL